MKHISKRTLVTGGVASLALLVGIGVGGAGNAAPTAESTPTPTVTVTAPAKVQTRTVEKVVKQVPSACLTALDKGDALLNTAGDALIIASGAIEHAADQDSASLNKDTDDLNALAPQLTRDKDAYDAAKAQCQSQAGDAL